MELEIIKRASEELLKRGILKAETGIVLGSGLGDLAEMGEERIEIPYREIPGFPVSTVEGHKGSLISCRLWGNQVLMMNGRVHLYEGYKSEELARPVRILHLLGVKTLILTNAAGAINRSFTPGMFMLITDHVNFTGANPLIGKNIEELGTRFPDMSRVYSEELLGIAERAALKLGIKTARGIYAWYTGPSYETPAEIRVMERLGIDAVGMSTVPEAIAAKHLGMNILAISCLTNKAAGISPVPLSHEEVFATAQKVKGQFRDLVREIIESITLQ